MRKYILNVISSGDEYSENELDSAIAILDDDDVSTILNRQRIFNQAKLEDSSLYAMKFWGGEAEFFISKDEDVDDRVECTVAPEGFEYEAERIECLIMVVTDDGVYWTCYRKHTSLLLSTEKLSYNLLKESA